MSFSDVITASRGAFYQVSVISEETTYQIGKKVKWHIAAVLMIERNYYFYRISKNLSFFFMPATAARGTLNARVKSIKECDWRPA